MSHLQQLQSSQQLQELTELYYTVPRADYEAALKVAVKQLQQVHPGFAIAFAEIFWHTAPEVHGLDSVLHVLIPVERKAQ